MNDAWKDIIAELDGNRRRLVDEIVHYPPPIPRCDVQYNTLLEERAGVAQELYRAEQLSRAAADGAKTAVLEEFVQSSIYLSGATKLALGPAADGPNRTAVRALEASERTATSRLV